MFELWANALASETVLEYFPPTLRGRQPSVFSNVRRSFRTVSEALYSGIPSPSVRENASAKTIGLKADPACRRA